MAEGESMETEDAESKNIRARLRLRKAIPTDRVTFSRQLDILRAIALESGRDKKPVSNDAVAKMANLHAGSISVCNPFFLDAGLLTRHKMQNLPCDEVFAYADSYEWDKEKATLKLAPIIRKAWFSEILIPKLIFRPLPVDEALGLLAEESGATKEHREQLATILEYMKVAGIISTDGGIVTVNKNGDESLSKNDKNTSPPKQNEIDKPGGEIEGFNLDPLILALLHKIPPHGEEWPQEKRLRWFRTFAMNVSQVYDDDDKPVELQISVSKSGNKADE